MKKFFFIFLFCVFLLGATAEVWAASEIMTVGAIMANGLRLTTVRRLSFGEMVVYQTVVVTATSPNAGEVLVETSPYAPITVWFSGSDGGTPTSQLELSDGATPVHHLMVSNIGVVVNGQTAIGNELNAFADSVGKASVIIIGEVSAGSSMENPPGEYEEEGYTNVILG